MIEEHEINAASQLLLLAVEQQQARWMCNMLTPVGGDRPTGMILVLHADPVALERAIEAVMDALVQAFVPKTPAEGLPVEDTGPTFADLLDEDDLEDEDLPQPSPAAAGQLGGVEHEDGVSAALVAGAYPRLHQGPLAVGVDLATAVDPAEVEGGSEKRGPLDGLGAALPAAAEGGEVHRGPGGPLDLLHDQLHPGDSTAQGGVS